jgi:hypothetical protein
MRQFLSLPKFQTKTTTIRGHLPAEQGPVATSPVATKLLTGTFSTQAVRAWSCQFENDSLFLVPE